MSCMMGLHRALLPLLLTLALCAVSPMVSAQSDDEGADDDEKSGMLLEAFCWFSLIMLVVIGIIAIPFLVKYERYNRHARYMEWRIQELEMRLKHEKRRRRAREIYIEVMEEEGEEA